MAVNNARKVAFAASELPGIIGNATTAYAARGKKIVTIDLRKDKPTSELVHKSLLGPTGNLRAPAILSGKNFLVGFNEELFERLFSK